MSDTKFSVDYSKRLSKCKKCKKEIEKGDCRLAKLVPNFFGDSDTEMKQFYHINCMFDSFKNARSTTKIIESADDIQDFESANKADQEKIISLIKTLNKGKHIIKTTISKKTVSKSISLGSSDIKTDTDESDDEEEIDVKKRKNNSDEDKTVKKIKLNIIDPSEDDKFETFQVICDRISEESSHLKKSSILREFFKNGAVNSTYTGDMYLFLKLILPSATNRVYNLNSKQLVKLYSKIFDVNFDEMNDHLNKGDVSNTCRHFFKKSNTIKPISKSVLYINQIDEYLDDLTKLTKENEQQSFLEKITKKFTLNDLRTFIRLIKKDLRIDAGAKNILDSVAPNAYAAYQVSRDLKDVVTRVKDLQKPGLKKDLSIRINLMTPVKPMLAEACKSVEQAFVKCKNGILAEIKYDGERLQVHKNGSKFNYFSRNLKQVQAHKVSHLKEFIPKAFPTANDIILDGEVLLYDTKNKKPLPFGTLGVHKKNAFKDATVCLFVFDCIYLNGEDLMNKTMKERRNILEKNMNEIPGHIMLSEQSLVKDTSSLRKLMMKTINEGLEGLVLKDTQSIYEPGKRHWLKMKKDYLDEGSMADTADLVVLGAYYGTGNKGGMKSIFLMGCLNEKTNKWHTVTKVANGIDDKTLEKLQKKIDMEEIKKKENLVPSWLVVNKSLIPDFVVKDPKNSPVWELTGAEFSMSDIHTANGISIRFPRITRFRDDKSWKEATSLERLKTLYKISKQSSDINNKNNNQNKNKEIKPDSESESEDNLPSLFKQQVFYINENVPKINELRRYIKAYDGEVVDKELIDQATHIILTDSDEKLPENAPKNIKKTTDKTIWRCIKNKKKL